MDAYGRSMRKTPGPGSPQPNLSQALDMFAGSTYTSKLAKEGGRISRVLEGNANDQEAIEEFYLATLTRLPTDQERTELLRVLSDHKGGRSEVLQNLMWALISSREFAYNH
jgi:hypothetical protein